MTINDDMLLIFLDSTVFIGARYNFDEKSKLAQLARLSDKRVLTIATSHIAVEETISHIKADVSVVIPKFQAARKKAPLCLRSESDFFFLFNSVPLEQMADKAIDNFKQHLQASQIRVLDSNGINIEQVMQTYFMRQPPFGQGKKKSEFPDAIMIEKIKSLLPKYTVWVVSSDTDFRAAAKAIPEIKHFNYLGDVLKEINRNDKFDKLLQPFFKAEIPSFYSQLETKLIEAIEVTGVSGTYWEDGLQGQEYDTIESIDVNELSWNDFYIDSIDEENYRLAVSLFFNTRITVICDFFDEEHSIWDGVDREWFFRYTGQMEEIHEAPVEAFCSLTFESAENISFHIEDIILDLNTVELSHDTLVKDRRIDDWRGYENDRYGGDEKEGYTTWPMLPCV